MNIKINPIWIIGCGDIGRRVARLYPNQTIHAVVRTKDSAALNLKADLMSHIVDLDTDYTLPETDLENAQIFYFSPPPTEGKQDTRLLKFTEEIKDQPQRIVLISTTGVYGDSQGKWIDENTPVYPVADRAHRRLSAESTLIKWAKKYQKEYMILRIPGIYATDRLPLARLKKGLAVVNSAEAGWTNRIHADDLAQACKAAMQCEQANQIINVCDGNPSTMTDYFNAVADFAGLPRPPQISMQEAAQTLSSGMVSYLKESRRIRNQKMLEELNITLQYPSLEIALKAN
ncbi:MAG: NAD-dependent epimerase/dehydratase family protein [Cocleimonas sp.]